MQDKLAILLSRKLSGEATSDELKELEEWIRTHPQDHYVIEALQSYWQNLPSPDFFNIADKSHFERILNKAETPVVPLPVQEARRTRPVWQRWVAAAIFIGFLALGGVMLNRHYFQKAGIAKSDIVTAPGTKSRIILPDGTKVWLNAATTLHFDKAFNGPLREVYLEGEAFFDVTKDKTRPFIVHTSDIDIRVLGTAFNVKSYKEEPTIEATLIHGSIQVSSKSKEGIPKIILNPNEKLVFNKLKGEIVGAEDPFPQIKEKEVQYLVSKINVAESDSSITETAWVHNRLLFDGDSFKELAVKMERWFDVQIKFENAEVANYRLRGAFEDETIEEALKALQQIASFKFNINENTVTITK